VKGSWLFRFSDVLQWALIIGEIRCTENEDARMMIAVERRVDSGAARIRRIIRVRKPHRYVAHLDRRVGISKREGLVAKNPEEVPYTPAASVSMDLALVPAEPEWSRRVLRDEQREIVFGVSPNTSTCMSWTGPRLLMITRPPALLARQVAPAARTMLKLKVSSALARGTMPLKIAAAVIVNASNVFFNFLLLVFFRGSNEMAGTRYRLLNGSLSTGRHKVVFFACKMSQQYDWVRIYCAK
jgi:hypothetical protein